MRFNFRGYLITLCELSCMHAHFRGNFSWKHVNLRKLRKLIPSKISGYNMVTYTCIYISVQTLEGLLKLWTHECSRIFEDRLVNNEDRDWFQQLLKKTMTTEFSVDPGEIIGDGPLLYGDFMMPNTDNKIYEEITDMEKVRKPCMVL